MSEPPYSWSSPSGDPAPPGQQPPPGYGPPPGQVPQGHQYGNPAWLQPGVVPLRPLALGDVLDGAIKVIRRYPKPTLGLSAVIALVVTVLNVVAVLVIGDHRPTVSGGSDPVAFDSQRTASDVTVALPAQLLGFLAGLVLTGALIVVVGRAVQGQEASLGEVWAAVRPRIWALLGLALLSGLIVGAPMAIGLIGALVLAAAGGGAALIIGIPLGLLGVAGTVYLYVRLSIAAPALVLEKAGVMQSLRRSGVLVRHSWWRVFGILLLTFVISLIVSGILAFPLGLVAALVVGGGDTTPVQVSQQVAAGLASVLIAPFSAGVRALLYVDRRMRAEGLDVALRAAVNPG